MSDEKPKKPRRAHGTFDVGQPPLDRSKVGRKKGTKNKIPKTAKELLNHGAAMIGGEHGIPGLIDKVGKTKPEVVLGLAGERGPTI